MTNSNDKKRSVQATVEYDEDTIVVAQPKRVKPLESTPVSKSPSKRPRKKRLHNADVSASSPPKSKKGKLPAKASPEPGEQALEDVDDGDGADAVASEAEIDGIDLGGRDDAAISDAESEGIDPEDEELAAVVGGEVPDEEEVVDVEDETVWEDVVADVSAGISIELCRCCLLYRRTLANSCLFRKRQTLLRQRSVDCLRSR